MRKKLFASSNTNWACFDCLTAIRRPAGLSPVRCPVCGKDALCLGTWVAVPPRQNLGAWRQLRSRVMQLRRESLERRIKLQVRARHHLERRIFLLESRPEGQDRDQSIDLLKKELQKL